MNNADIDYTINELKQTTTGYVNKNWTSPPVGTHWKNALDRLIAGKVVAPVPTPTPGNLVFADEFDGPAGSPPDPNNWYNVDGLQAMQASYSKAENAYLDGNGHLVLRVKRDTYVGKAFSGGTICTYKYGWGWPPPAIKKSWSVPFRYEAMVKFPNVDNAWVGPGWNQNVDRPNTQDIFELDCGETNSKNRFGMGANQHTWLNSGQKQGADGWMVCTDNRTNWHTVAVEARTTGCTYMIDGVPLKTQYGVSGRFGAMLHNQIGDAGFWDFTAPDPNDPGPWHMLVDYVRVYSL